MYPVSVGLILALFCICSAQSNQLRHDKHDKAVCDSSDDQGYHNASYKHCQTGSQSTIPKGYNLAMESVAGFCVSECCSVSLSDVETWTIHGLWPTLDGDPKKGVCCCQGIGCSEVDVSKLDSAIPNFERYWPDLIQRKESIWYHEWCKHGTCTINSLSSEDSDPQIAYFTKAVDLYKENNVTNILGKKSIVPSNDEGYELDNIKDALYDYFGAYPHIHCETIDSKQYLYQIVLCMDEDFNPIDCEKKSAIQYYKGHKHKCNEQTTYYFKTFAQYC